MRGGDVRKRPAARRRASFVSNRLRLFRLLLAGFFLTIAGATSFFNDTDTHVAAQEAASNPGPIAVPTLLAPVGGAKILQNDPNIGCSFAPYRGYGFKIEFDWSDASAPSGIGAYELYVTHKGSLFPLIDNQVVATSQYTFRSCSSFTYALDGWQWRVRAWDTKGNYSDWTPVGEFGFTACVLADGSLCRTDQPTPSSTPTDTPLDTPTPLPVPDMVMNVSGGVCNDPTVPTTCDVPLNSTFSLSVDTLTPPTKGYVLAQTFVDFGTDLTYKPTEKAIEEVVWPDCDPEIVVRQQVDQTQGPPTPPPPYWRNSNRVVSHGCVTGVVPPLAESDHAGGLVEFDLTCSADISSTQLSLLPYDDSAFGSVQGTNGAAFVLQDDTLVVPNVSDLTINCVVPSAVGGVSLDGGLDALPLQSARPNLAWWCLAAAGLIVTASTTMAFVAVQRPSRRP